MELSLHRWAQMALPRVLIVGDSISMGYHDALVQRLRGVAHVCRPAVNCSSTRTGLENLSSWPTEHGPEPWDLIQFNHGLHGTQRARARIPARTRCRHQRWKARPANWLARR